MINWGQCLLFTVRWEVPTLSDFCEIALCWPLEEMQVQGISTLASHFRPGRFVSYSLFTRQILSQLDERFGCWPYINWFVFSFWFVSPQLLPWKEPSSWALVTLWETSAPNQTEMFSCRTSLWWRASSCPGAHSFKLICLRSTDPNAKWSSH